jgi:hypothetical protein
MIDFLLSVRASLPLSTIPVAGKISANGITGTFTARESIGDLYPVGEALRDRTDGSGIAAVGPFPLKAAWLAASLAC